jgi:hypothetical protein
LVYKKRITAQFTIYNLQLTNESPLAVKLDIIAHYSPVLGQHFYTHEDGFSRFFALSSNGFACWVGGYVFISVFDLSPKQH